MTSNRPKISVVTISFNQRLFLERCLNSVLYQQGVDIEYVVVDPGSTDGSRELIDAYRDRLAHVIYDKDEGPADGLNQGLARCTGEYFYFLNSDDVVADGAFSEAAAIFEKTKADVVYGNGWIIDADGNRLRHAYSAQRVTPRLYARGLAVILQQAAFIRTSALKEVGGFNRSNTTCWDGEAFLDMALNGCKFVRVWRDWGEFRVYADSISGSGRLNEKYERDQARLREKVLGSGRTLSPLANKAAWLAVKAMDVRRVASAVGL